MVASSWACSRHGGRTRHNSCARTRGGICLASFWRSISQSGCGYDPTSETGSSLFANMLTSRRSHDEAGARETHVHVADLRVGAFDHDLLRARTDELARDRILADVVGRDLDPLARLAAGGAHRNL